MLFDPLPFYPMRNKINGVDLAVETFADLYEFGFGLWDGIEDLRELDHKIQGTVAAFCLENREKIGPDMLKAFALYYRYKALLEVERHLPPGLVSRDGFGGARKASPPAVKAAALAELKLREPPKEKAHMLAVPYFVPKQFMAIACACSGGAFI